MRIRDQWRLCLVWTVEGNIDIEVVDYHCRRSNMRPMARRTVRATLARIERCTLLPA